MIPGRVAACREALPRARARSRAAALLVLLAAGGAAAQPMEVDLVDTLANCDPGLAAGVVIGETSVLFDPLDVGYRFTVEPDGFWIATELTVCVSTATGMPGQEFSLRTDEGGVPGELLYAFTVFLPLEPTLVTDDATVRPAKLASGASYWLVAEASFQQSIWWLPVPDAGTALQAQRVDGGAWQTLEQPLPQLRLRALPEPAPGPVAAFATILVLAASRRCRRTARADALRRCSRRRVDRSSLPGRRRRSRRSGARPHRPSRSCRLRRWASPAHRLVGKKVPLTDQLHDVLRRADERDRVEAGIGKPPDEALALNRGPQRRDGHERADERDRARQSAREPGASPSSQSSEMFHAVPSMQAPRRFGVQPQDRD